MGEVTLKIPGECVEFFRLATVVEIGSDAKWVASSQEEFLRHYTTSGYTGEDQLGDVRGSVRCLGEDMDVLNQLFPWPSGRDVRGESSALAHTLETMADKVLAPRISSESNCSPFDGEAVEKIGALTEALGWAAGEAARLHAVAGAECQAAKAGAA